MLPAFGAFCCIARLWGVFVSCCQHLGLGGCWWFTRGTSSCRRPFALRLLFVSRVVLHLVDGLSGVVAASRRCFAHRSSQVGSSQGVGVSGVCSIENRSVFASCVLDRLSILVEENIGHGKLMRENQSAEFPQMIIIYCVKVVQKKNEGHKLWWWLWWRMMTMDSIFGKEAIPSTADPR